MTVRSAQLSRLFQCIFILGASVTAGGLGLAVLNPARLTRIERSRALDARIIGPDRLHDLQNPILLDVRPKVAFDQNHLEGARWVPALADEFHLRRLLSDVEMGRPIVVYCTPTCRLDRHVASTLIRAGFENVWILEGGYHQR